MARWGVGMFRRRNEVSHLFRSLPAPLLGLFDPLLLLCLLAGLTAGLCPAGPRRTPGWDHIGCVAVCGQCWHHRLETRDLPVAGRGLKLAGKVLASTSRPLTRLVPLFGDMSPTGTESELFTRLDILSSKGGLGRQRDLVCPGRLPANTGRRNT